MWHGIKFRCFLVLLPIAACGIGAGCAPDRVELDHALALGQQLATQGKDGVPPCLGCHGVQGEGIGPFPRLAAQDPRYLERQLADFARDLPAAGVHLEPIARDYSETPRIYSNLTVFTPAVRQDAIMTPIAKQLSADERRHLALYYASLAFAAKPVAADFQTLERGQDLALRGKPEYGVPACISCHAPDGQGFGEHFPPLAGQSADYLVEQVNRWQSGQRDNDNMGLMRTVANQLTDGDKRNVAAYFANRSFAWTGYEGDWPW
jgi:cytochrome c553